jgi:uncharacterized repeat protein (TIGR01451 family)
MRRRLLLSSTAVGVLAVSTVAPAAAETISNVASVSWEQGRTTVTRMSNRVAFQVETPPTPAATLLTYEISTSRVGETLPLAGAVCRAPGAGPVPTPITGDATVVPTASQRANAPFLFAMDLSSANVDPERADTVDVLVETADGDRETVTIVETAANSGRFAGALRTAALRGDPVLDDCTLSVRAGGRAAISVRPAAGGEAIAAGTVDVLIDPSGIVFDSRDGAPVSGVRVTIVDAATGRPAAVFGDDGRSSYPSTVITGANVTDGGGNFYAYGPGDYRFPLLAPGRYRLVVEPDAPYSAPSKITPAALAALRRPDGEAFTIFDASYGAAFTLSSPAPVRIDVPLDRPPADLVVTKTASRTVAMPGDTVLYSVTVRNADRASRTGQVTLIDDLPAWMRIARATVRVDGAAPAQGTVTLSPDGARLSLALGVLAADGTRHISYALEVRPDARPGEALNRARAVDDHGARSIVADAMVRIERDSIADRLTIIGQVLDGGCQIDPRVAKGVPGVRFMLEDGSYAVTDRDGRYHFEGVLPGLHVVQMDGSTLPVSMSAVDCVRTTRSSGSAISRFVEGGGGQLKRVDFHAATGGAPRAAEAARPVQPTALGDAKAAGADRDWFAGQKPGVDWIFPEPDHNPRAKAVRVAIKHLPGQTVALFNDGKPVEGIAFEGARRSPDGSIAVSLWRGVPIGLRDTRLSAEVRDAKGVVVERLTRTVHFSASPLQAVVVREKSVLLADGVTRPVIAVKLFDRDGRPVHHGLVGDYAVPAPYYPAVDADAQQARQLSGLERARPVWRVKGDDGIAYVELEPTTATGTVTLTFPFRDGEVTRAQSVEVWLDPGERPWTVVGFAAGTLGFNTLEGHLERLNEQSDKLQADARLALYAKGRVKGKWLMTLAYDSDKEDETRFAGVIDPQAYYTIYADGSERRFDAASVRKLYIRLERPQFYALFGDYETGINEPVLTRYARALNGVKAEYRGDRVAATAFAADTPYRHRREELQGNGLSGPYALGSRDVLPNSEQVVIQVRDRIRSDRILETRQLVRHIDYDIDYAAGTLRFREPILSRSSGLDPQFIIVDYEVDRVAGRSLNAGGRGAWTSADKRLRIAATAVHDEDDLRSTDLGGVDLRFRPSAETEIRAEVAVSDAGRRSDAISGEGGAALAWIVEAEHHGPRYDLLAYAREQEGGFGVGQQNAPEVGTRKFGLDGRVRFTPDLSLSGSAWQEDQLTTDARRRAGRLLGEYRTKSTDLRAGVTIAEDLRSDGQFARSTIGQIGATRRLFDNRLELGAQTEVPIGDDASVDFPARHKFGARFAVTPDVQLVGAYEIAQGETVDARTARIGFDLKPWAGARLTSTLNQQDIAEYGPRSFAAYGLVQSVQVNKRWSVDFSLDGNKTLGGIDPAAVLSPNQPVASGGFLPGDGTLTEDFTAVTAGATYRAGRWSVTGRAEYRAGDRGDRYGLTAAALRQIGEGSALAGAFTLFDAESDGGVATRATNLALSWAHRPQASRWSFLEKLELREDRVTGAVRGQPGPIGGAPLLIGGNARSRRIVNSLSVNFSPTISRDGEHLDRSEFSVFWGTRYVFDRYGDQDIEGWSNMVGVDLRFDVSDRIEVGGSGNIRQGAGGDVFAYAVGPNLGLRPFDNGWLSVGYNVVGFEDRDFDRARYTRSGPYVTMRLKFDQDVLGLARR